MEDIRELIKQSLKKAFECVQANNNFNAEELYRQILRVSPEEKEALEVGSLVLCRNRKPEEALSWCLKALEIEETYETHNSLALIYGNLNQSDKAIDHFKKAIIINPKKNYLYVNLAVEIKKAGDTNKAISILDSIPANADTLFNKGAILQEIGNLEEAKNLYLKALKKRYNFPVCHYNLSACYFLLNDYENGWKEYEWRWKQFERFAKIRNKFKEPFWNGESLKGKTIVLYGEQGIGDTLMFIRFIKYLEGHVVLECPSNLHKLLNNYEVYEEYKGKLDYHCSLMSLPGILNIKVNSEPYLNVKKSEWNQCKEKKIGICWAGNPIHPNDRNRSCFLSYFKGLERFGKVFSFQKDIRARGYHDNTAINFTDCKFDYVDLSPFLHDFNETASFLSHMDLVISVDTSVAHLSAAMGKETWILLPWMPDWRWSLVSKESVECDTGSKTDWYDSVLLIKEKTWEETWSKVYEKLNKSEYGTL